MNIIVLTTTKYSFVLFKILERKVSMPIQMVETIVGKMLQNDLSSSIVAGTVLGFVFIHFYYRMTFFFFWRNKLGK